MKQSANPAIVVSNNAGRVNPQEQLLGLVSAVVESSISQLQTGDFGSKGFNKIIKYSETRKPLQCTDSVLAHFQDLYVNLCAPQVL